MKHSFVFLVIFLFFSCTNDTESIIPEKESITESVYASGTIESTNQYQVFSSVSGIINAIYLEEGDLVTVNTPLFSINNETSVVNRQNAELNASYSSIGSNNSRIKDLSLSVELAKSKMINDSIQLERQKNLYQKDAISKSQLELIELTYQNSKTAYISALYKLADLRKQLNFNDQQSRNNAELSKKLENDFIIKSISKGRVYSILRKKGEMVSPQTPVAIIGDAKDFLIRLQVDEYDIIKIKKGQQVIISLDSYKGETFEARVTKIDPIMNERSKTFNIEAVFTKRPNLLYPNLSLEANIIIREKKNALIIPRMYLIDDKYVFLENGDKRTVKTGLKDYQKVEIIEGLSISDKIIIPEK